MKESTSSIVSVKNDIVDALDMISLLENDFDDDMFNFVSEVYSGIDERVSALELELLLSGPYDTNNAIVEIHSGAGGTEACDWALMLYRMYTRWCEKKNYSIEVLDLLDGDEAGIKRVSFLVKGLNAYGYLKCEKGIHRLVRLSPFDSNNKRHTSFASVDVMPEFDSDIDIEVKDEDLKIDVYRSSGAGGQGVNTTDSAVRITHLPTKIVVTCQNERSQIKNKEKAFKILKTRLYDLKLREKEEADGEVRRSKIGTGDRSEKIRTYNYPQNRLTDHRIGFTSMNLDRIMDGDLGVVIAALINEDQKRKLEGEDNL